MRLTYTKQALKDIDYWKKKNDKKVNKKIKDLIKSILVDYKTGIGKPEYLKHLKLWSRRINQEHRIIYEPMDNAILIHRLKGHYD